MIDMRYHVISLVAVFLALAIGILLGTTLVERGLIAEQKSQIKSLKTTFDEIKKKNESLNEDLKVFKDYAGQAEGFVVANRLAGRNYALLKKPDSDPATADTASKTISAAGGTVPVTITVFSDKMNDSSVQDSLAAMFSMPKDKNALYSRFCQEMVNQLATLTNPALLTSFSDLGLIKIEGTLAAPVNGGVFVSSETSDYDDLQNGDIPIIKGFVSASLPLLAVGGAKTPDTALLTYKKSGIATVDRIDEAPGQMAMVLSLDGRWGNYGRGESADRLLPGI